MLISQLLSLPPCHATTRSQNCSLATSRTPPLIIPHAFPSFTSPFPPPHSHIPPPSLTQAPQRSTESGPVCASYNRRTPPPSDGSTESMSTTPFTTWWGGASRGEMTKVISLPLPLRRRQNSDRDSGRGQQVPVDGAAGHPLHQCRRRRGWQNLRTRRTLQVHATLPLRLPLEEEQSPRATI